MRIPFIIIVSACQAPVKGMNTSSATVIEIEDLDADGYDSTEDCDDEDPLISPNAEEICDEVDNNCDPQIDEGVQNTYYLDFDTDGFGDASNTLMACNPIEGYVLNGDDCNDADTQAFPNAVEF